jgi:hypothetical protein
MVLGLLILQAGLTIGFALLPTDAAGMPATTVGRLHLVDFYLYAITMPLTLVVIGLVMRRDGSWSWAAQPTLAAGGLVVLGIALVPATLDGPLTPWLGLLERLFVAVPSIWQVWIGIAAWRRLA